jgi:hypothetical protein
MYRLIAGSAKRAVKQLCVSWLFVNEVAKNLSTQRNEIDKPMTRKLQSVGLHHSGHEAASESRSNADFHRPPCEPKLLRFQAARTQSEVV